MTKVLSHRGRSEQSLRRQYEIERELADRLRAATPEQRMQLYRTVYNDLFARVPDHPQNTWKVNTEAQHARTAAQMRFLRRFLRPHSVYLEIGCGDCDLTIAVARKVRHAYGLDVSDVISARDDQPPNFSFVLSEGISVSVPPEQVDVAYSNSLIEHLHPDDAAEQTARVLKALAPAGRYVCVTPHLFSGPQDISGFFELEPKGLHLKEYTYRELKRLFLRAGYKSTSAWIGIKGRFCRIPLRLVLVLESVLGLLPPRMRKWTATSLVGRRLFSTISMVGHKSAGS
jgi:ubiquinone/menaquinone biosynthesis C-methylase UbiE